MIEAGDNRVILVDTYGSDLTHALSAWTSTQRELTEKRRQRVGSFLAQLAENGHQTPFEKSTLHFLATTDIATHIHLLKHRIGVSVNSESARYMEQTRDKGYVPYDWPPEEQEAYTDFLVSCFCEYHTAIERLISKGMSRSRAKESARFYLPYGFQYTVDLTFNWRSFWHFLSLRYHMHAQAEVRRLARWMLELVVGIEGQPFKETLKAFGLTNSKGQILRPFKDGDFIFVPKRGENEIDY